jgi:hypothetical protein
MEANRDPGLGKGLGGSSDQLALVFDYITDVIGGGSGCKGDMLTRFENGHLQFRRLALRLGCSAWPAGSPADYNQFFRHENLLRVPGEITMLMVEPENTESRRSSDPLWQITALRDVTFPER